MEYEYRVVVTGDTSDGFVYTIEEVWIGTRSPFLPPTHPIVRHQEGLLVEASMEKLAKRLDRLKEALDKPILALKPAHTTLVEVKE